MSNSKSLGRRTQRKLRNRRGAALVEFAVVSPLFVAILLGTIEACSMVFLRQSVEMAAYEASRVAIVTQTKTDQVQQAAKNVLDSRKVKDYTIKITPTDFQGAPYGSFIQVEVTAPCSSNSLIPVMFYSGQNVVGQVEMMKEY
jgi:Flp pilus assembly protein TadG